VALVAAVGIVSAAEGNLFWLSAPPANACLTMSYPPGQTPLGSSLAFGAPFEQVRGPNHWYNFSVQSAGGGITWGELALQVVTATGANVTPAASWSGGAWGYPDVWVATYDFAGQDWSVGGSAVINSTQTLVLDSGSTDLSAMGYALNVLGRGCFQGSVSISIP
jgi:hypothetical protein